jgi:Fe-S-cluster-containing dehydrogenase component
VSSTTDRELTFDDILRYVGSGAAQAKLDAAPEGQNCTPAAHVRPRTHSCGSHGAGMSGGHGAGCGSHGASGMSAAPCSAAPTMTQWAASNAPDTASAGRSLGILEKHVGRRGALGMMFGAVAAASQAVSACSPVSAATDEEREAKLLDWGERLKGNFRQMTDDEKQTTIDRLERLAKIRRGTDVRISTTDAQPGVMYGYAFNISKCKGYRNCVEACINENNLDRRAGTQYIRIFEMGDGVVDLDHGDATYHHDVPAAGHFYMGTQCFQCANPPCVQVCPVGATWQEPDGITVIDYDWCIGCRYCMAACPYWARRFNWAEPDVPAAEENPNQHYLGNRAKKKGVVEKCTFCIQRTREGQLPACAEACPTGARVFGNLLDPGSEIRWVLANKRVFRLKEDLKTEPRFWYFSD